MLSGDWLVSLGTGATGCNILFSLLLLSLSFDNLIMMYLDVDLFEFVQLGLYWSSWMCRWMFFIELWKFWPLFLQIISVSVSSGTTFVMHILICLIVSHSSLRFCSFFFILFLSQTRSSQLTYHHVHWLFFSATSNLSLRSSSDMFNFSCWTSYLQNFYLVIFLKWFLCLYSYSVWWDVILRLSFSSFPHDLLSFFECILKSWFKSLFSKPSVSLLQRHFLLTYFTYCIGLYFLVSLNVL